MHSIRRDAHAPHAGTAHRLDPSRPGELARDTTVTLTPREREALRHWGASYERQRQMREATDPVRSRRQRDAARAFAFLLVGLPLFGYHWRTIRKKSAGFLA